MVGALGACLTDAFLFDAMYILWMWGIHKLISSIQFESSVTFRT